ncbi:hypothetical protein C6P45_000342 [Maudiozyma exigua]|uniref:Ras-GAP domain-containing protein n=1 Tax=Maudiozyma exigua TaxID=34358 RepID=A0A9P7B880_MAUEX|nr:hypothetical protein C6P45_000342 [Kazachstania exigua]
MSRRHDFFDFGKVTLEDYAKRVEYLGGTFKGEIRWTTNIKLNDWKTHFLEITKTGSLIHSIDKKQITSLQNDIDNKNYNDLIIDKKNIHPVVENMSGCKIRILKNVNSKDKIIRNIIKVSECSQSQNSSAIYLNVVSETKMFDLFCSLTWWSSLKPKGIFNKITLSPKRINSQTNINKIILSSKLNIFGPLIEQTKEIPELEIPRMFIQNNDSNSTQDSINYKWFLVKANLYSNGELHINDITNERSLFAINIKNLIRSEIRLLDFSLFQNDNSLFIGILPQLREQLRLLNNGQGTTFFNLINSEDLEFNRLILNFNDCSNVRDDWLIALKSFAISELLSLNESDRSNELRISNNFKLTLLEAEFQTLNLSNISQNDIYLHAEIWMWGQMWARTPSIKNDLKPFWREEFKFIEDINVENFEIRLVQEITEANKEKVFRYETLGTFTLDQKSITSDLYRKENRALVFAEDHEHFQVATLCFKIDHNIEFILPSVNFIKFQTALTSIPLTEITKLVYDNIDNFTSRGKLDMFSQVTLEFFQTINKEETWFQALMEKELSDIDSAILRNSNNNQSSDHIFSTLFRGNSILTKSTELYFFNVGNEYIKQVIRPILIEIIDCSESCEIDPTRISLPEDERRDVINANHKRLIGWVSKLWRMIYRTSKDLPVEIRNHLKTFRRELEKFCLKDNEEATLNCISGFLFLRYFCPVILNPKLFNITWDHLNDTNRRTLTLVCKILLNLSTLKTFGDKEPYMVDVNLFIEENRDKLKSYIDKVTEKKLDFTQRMFNLENVNKSLLKDVVFNQEELKELPVNPFLLDKGLRNTEFMSILNTLNEPVRELNEQKKHKSKKCTNDESVDIGDLEFEKLTENNAEIFGDEFMQYLEVKDDDTDSLDNDNISDVRTGSHANDDIDSKNDTISLTVSSQNTDGTLIKRLLQEVSLTCFKKDRIIRTMSDSELPSDEMYNNFEYGKRLGQRIYFTDKRKIIMDSYASDGLLLESSNKCISLFNNGTNQKSKMINESALFYFDDKNTRNVEDNGFNSDNDHDDDDYDSSESEENDEQEYNRNEAGANFYMGNVNSASTRTLSKFANLIKGGSFHDSKTEEPKTSPSKLTRWFKKK